MMKEKEAVKKRVMVLCDAFVITLAFLLAFMLRKNFYAFCRAHPVPYAENILDLSSMSMVNYWVILLFLVPIWCAMLYLNGMYHSMRTKTILQAVWIVIKSALLTILIFGSVTFLLKLEFVSRIFFVFFLSIGTMALIAEKTVMFSVMRALLKQGYNLRRLLIVGTGKRAAQFTNKIISHPEWGFKIVGAVDYENIRVDESALGARMLGTLENLPSILHRMAVNEVIFIVPRSKLNVIEDSIGVCETEGVRATVAVDLFDLKIAKFIQTELDGIPLVTFETTVAGEWQLLLKRTADIMISGLGLVLLSPVFLITAISIKLTSKGPVFFRQQKRAGLNGRKFVLYKFRSMREGAHLKRSELEGLNEMSGPVFKIKNDPRITPLGRFLRRFSIDELPQLFNVFIGQMSLVGPRALPVYEVAKFEPWQRRRLSMRPGITCLWQISGRNKIDFEEWMRLDIEYIDNWSLWLDFKVFIKTIPAVLFGRGAY